MPARKPISKKMRFEVFKRDSFTCQYCGKQSPEVVLHVDHIKPVAKGGKNTLLNLVTSCQDCNLGKGARELSDDAEVVKQRSELELMAEKRSQVELMIKWRETLQGTDELMVESVVKHINTLMVEWSVSEHGKTTVRKSVKKHGYQAVMDSIDSAYERSKSAEDFSKKWSGACLYAGNQSSGNSIHYFKGILRNRFNGFNDKQFYAECNGLILTDEIYNQLLPLAKGCETLMNFYDAVWRIKNG